MDVVAVLLACSLHPDDALVRALIEVQSGGNAYHVVDARSIGLGDTEPIRASPASLEEARAALEHVQAAHGRPLVGLLALPAPWATLYGRTPEALFDPCTSVAIGTAMLSAFDHACGGRPSPQGAPPTRLRRPCILRRYAAALGVDALADAVEMQLRVSRARRENAPRPAEHSAVFADGTDDSSAEADWSNERLFFPLTEPVPKPASPLHLPPSATASTAPAVAAPAPAAPPPTGRSRQ